MATPQARSTQYQRKRMRRLCLVQQTSAAADRKNKAYANQSMNGDQREDKPMNSNPMRVILGVSSLKAYVTAPKAFHVLGIVRFGMEYGLLATNADGLYFRVNGSQILALQSEQVLRAIASSYGAGGRFASNVCPYAASHPNALDLPLSVPTISFRKHRQVRQANLHSQHAEQAANA